MTPALAFLLVALQPSPGVQWFTDIKQGLDEAKRTGMPIMLLSAAPQCSEVPGNW